MDYCKATDGGERELENESARARAREEERERERDKAGDSANMRSPRRLRNPRNFRQTFSACKQEGPAASERVLFACRACKQEDPKALRSPGVQYVLL